MTDAEMENDELRSEAEWLDALSQTAVGLWRKERAARRELERVVARMQEQLLNAGRDLREMTAQRDNFLAVANWRDPTRPAASSSDLNTLAPIRPEGVAP